MQLFSILVTHCMKYPYMNVRETEKTDGEPCSTPAKSSGGNAVVVIGAGVAGLTVAAILAKAGLKVSLFEREPQAGGYLAAFRRGHFIFDTSVQWLNQFRPRGFVFRIHRFLGEDGPRCRMLDRIHRYKGTHHDYLLTSKPLEFRDQLLRDFPTERDGIIALFADAEKLGKHLLFLDDRMRAACTMTFREKMKHAFDMMRWAWPIRHVVSTSAKKGLHRYFKSTDLRNLFHSNDTMMSVLVPLGFAFTGDFQALPEGGGGAIVDWLCKMIVKKGGEIHLSSGVSEVVVDDQRVATGVRLSNGQLIQADYVVAACDSQLLFGEMVPHEAVFERWRRRMANADLYHSSFTIYLGLNCPPSLLGMNEELVHLTEDSVHPSERVSGDAQTTTISVFAPSFRDPTLASPGKGTLQIQCPAYLAYQDRWKTGPNFERGEAYNTLKKQYAEALLERVERNLIPGLRQHIEEMTVATPITFFRYTGNQGGGIMGLRPTSKNIRAGLAQIKTPIKRLLLGGQWAAYGGGVPIATKSAVNASLLILRDLRPDAFNTLKAVVDGRN